MEVHLTQSQEAQLTELAVQTGRGTDELLQEAIAEFLAQDRWIGAQVQVGMDQIKSGQFIEEDDMDLRVQRILSSKDAYAGHRLLQMTSRKLLISCPYIILG